MQIRFSKVASQKDREAVLAVYQQIAAQNTNSTSKKLILSQVAEYAKNKLVGFVTRHIDANRFIQVNNIFAYAHLNDLLFMQYVINTLSGIQNDDSKLRDTVLPNAILYRDLLLKPTVEKIQKIAIGTMLPLGYLEPWLILPALFVALAAHPIAVNMLQSQLANVQSMQLAKILGMTGEAKIGTPLDPLLDRAADLSTRAVTQVANRALDAAENAVQRLEGGASVQAALPASAAPRKMLQGPR